MKLCLACSAGGHLTQLLQLKEFYLKHDYFILTEDAGKNQGLSEDDPVYFLRLTNRQMWYFPILMLTNAWRSLRVLLREKPDVVISTGALSAVAVCYLAKLMRIKVIFIESYARVNTPNISGRLVYPLADLFIVQWEKLREIYPKAVYGGSIY